MDAIGHAATTDRAVAALARLTDSIVFLAAGSRLRACSLPLYAQGHTRL
jgi:hypothetical protein